MPISGTGLCLSWPTETEGQAVQAGGGKRGASSSALGLTVKGSERRRELCTRTGKGWVRGQTPAGGASTASTREGVSKGGSMAYLKPNCAMQ